LAETVQTPPYTVSSDEKVSKLVVYSNQFIYWGEVVTKQMIRVSTWLRTNSAPDWVCLYNVKAMSSIVTTPPKPLLFTELHISVPQILAYHLMPPMKDPPDFDPTEPNRQLQPVSLLVGAIRIDGALRLSVKSSVAKYLEVAREPFTGVYDARITNVNMPGMGELSVPFLLARQEHTVFTCP
jgi:hypothetical protein